MINPRPILKASGLTTMPWRLLIYIDHEMDNLILESVNSVTLKEIAIKRKLQIGMGIRHK